jgi:predicted transcriptional regulator
MFNKYEFNAALARKGMKKVELARLLDIEYSTLYRKIEENGKFTREEMAKIIKELDIDDPMKIFFAEELVQD